MKKIKLILALCATLFASAAVADYVMSARGSIAGVDLDALLSESGDEPGGTNAFEGFLWNLNGSSNIEADGLVVAGASAAMWATSSEHPVVQGGETGQMTFTIDAPAYPEHIRLGLKANTGEWPHQKTAHAYVYFNGGFTDSIGGDGLISHDLVLEGLGSLTVTVDPNAGTFNIKQDGIDRGNIYFTPTASPLYFFVGSNSSLRMQTVTITGN